MEPESEVPTPQDRQLNEQNTNNQIDGNLEKRDASGDEQIGEQMPERLEENLDIKSHKIRYGLLAVLFSGGLLILGRSLIDGNLGKPTPFTFPDQIEFAPPSMKLAQAKPPEPIIDEKNFFGRSKYLFGEKYSYLVDNTPIDIELRYLVGTEGDLVPFVKELGNIDINDEQLRTKSIRRDPIGFHAFLSSPNRAYLTSCINPRGIATVTKEQFDDNGSNQATNRDVVISWLLGQQDLRDRRCLWTLISTPISSESDREVANQKLEKIWISWYEWWKPRFPAP
jgi:cyanosortase A-associated protein